MGTTSKTHKLSIRITTEDYLKLIEKAARARVSKTQFIINAIHCNKIVQVITPDEINKIVETIEALSSITVDIEGQFVETSYLRRRMDEAKKTILNIYDKNDDT